MPLHEELAVAQALVPLQELTPLHFTLPSADATVTAPALANIAAAVAAMKARFLMFCSRFISRMQNDSAGPAREVRAWRWNVIASSLLREARRR